MAETKKGGKGWKIFLGILGVLLLPIAVLLLVQWVRYLADDDPYKTFLIPRAELSVFEVTTLDMDRTNLLGTMLIHNPLPVNLRADSLQYKVFISGKEVIKSTYPQSVNIKRWDSTWIQLPVTAYTETLLAVLTEAENAGKDSVVYEVQSSFASNVIFRKQFNMDMEKLLPLIYIPKVEMEKIQWDSLNAEGVSLFLHATVVNKNKFPLNFKDLNFRFALADHPWVKGAAPGTIIIPDSSVTPLVMPLRISFKEIGKSIWPLIKEGRNTEYKFDMNLKMASESNVMKNSQVVFKGDGAIKEITNVVKEERREAKEEKQALKEQGIEPPKKDKDDKIKIEKKKD